MHYLVFDIETKNIFDDVGKNDPALLDLSLVGVYDYKTDSYESFLEEEMGNLWPIIERADALVGFNSDHFDIPLLNKYYPGDLGKIKSIDLMATIKEALGRRLSLNNVANATLGVGKSSDGLQAVRWWKEGEIGKIREYCLQDVKVTKDLFEYMRTNKKVLYRDGPSTHELAVDVSGWEGGEHALTHTLGL